MIGIDMTRISRFNNKLKKVKFIERILHPEEIIEFKKTQFPSKFLASRWAIKEALFKCNNDFYHFDKILIKVKNNQFNFFNYKITTSQEGDYYIAMVIKGHNESKN